MLHGAILSYKNRLKFVKKYFLKKFIKSYFEKEEKNLNENVLGNCGMPHFTNYRIRGDHGR